MTTAPPFPHETKATVLLDSICNGVRLTTFVVTFHRKILAEVNTHRRASRNSASSRAIPLETMLQRAIDFPALPVKWPREQPGMSGGAELEGYDLIDAARCLADIRDSTTRILTEYIAAHPDKSTRLHKSLLNRPLEWFMWHTAVISATEWDNLFKQRISPKAQPEFNLLAEMMREALDASVPIEIPIDQGFWHLPFIGSNPDDNDLTLEEKKKVSAARCARVSYMTHDGQRSIEADLKLYEDTLAAYGHWSPLEHVATPSSKIQSKTNFHSPWIQLRQLVEV